MEPRKRVCREMRLDMAVYFVRTTKDGSQDHYRWELYDLTEMQMKILRNADFTPWDEDDNKKALVILGFLGAAQVEEALDEMEENEEKIRDHVIRSEQIEKNASPYNHGPLPAARSESVLIYLIPETPED